MYICTSACLRAVRKQIYSHETPNHSPLPSTKPSAHSPTQAGARHTLRPDEHPRTTKAVTAEATASHRCSRQLQTRPLGDPHGQEVWRLAPARPCDWMSTHA